MDSEVREVYFDKVIIELRSEALAELSKNRWQELPKQREKHVQRPWGLLKHDYYETQFRWFMQVRTWTVKNDANAIILNYHYYLFWYFVLELWQSFLWAQPKQLYLTLEGQMDQSYRTLEISSDKRVRKEPVFSFHIKWKTDKWNTHCHILLDIILYMLLSYSLCHVAR